MSMSDLIAAIAVLMAIGSFIVAVLAYRRSSEAAALQSRIDEREREFREVSWHTGWRGDIEQDQTVILRLENTGLTSAVQVTLVLEMQGGDQAFHMGDIPAGDFADAHPRTDLKGPVGAAFLALSGNGVAFRVHWSSPLGQVGTFSSRTPTDVVKPGDALLFE